MTVVFRSLTPIAFAAACMAGMIAVPSAAEAALLDTPFHSAADDSLALPGEVFVLTAAELARLDINSLEDLVAILPGLSMWQEGPPGSRAAFSVDGRSWKGITLLVNGVPQSDPYSGDPLARFLTLSRLRQVEVIRSASPSLTGRASGASVVNIVMEEGGRTPPVAAGDFSWGGNGRATRRAWFSTPDAFLTGTIAYDEYLQDYFESLDERPSALIGEYHGRTVLVDLALRGESDHRALLRIRRFEDASTGTRNWPDLRDPYNPPEEVRRSGFDSELRYLWRGAGVSLRQRLVETDRRAGRTSGLVVSASAFWAGRLGPFAVKGFASAERLSLENRLWSVPFSPDLDLFEGGVTAGSGGARGFRWRAGVSGGWLGESGGFAGAEAALSRGEREGLSQSLIVARRVRVPTAEELLQPPLDRLIDGTALPTSGGAPLGAELCDEATLTLGLPWRISVDLFARSERDRIFLEGSDPAVQSGTGADDVAGIRGTASGGGATGLLGFDYGWRFSGVWYADKATITESVPSHAVRCGIWASRRSFRSTETFTVRVDLLESGERRWEDAVLDRYATVDLSASITVIGAVVRFELKNILDEEYRTVPGLLMPGRQYRFGINWRLFD
ncbi:MAG: TonB-dependent receptor [Candidatus Krumholzibacteria bacterium]|nr:TonB-dependent receptor [Candidatus Krumholzibacteria bacterium]